MEEKPDNIHLTHEDCGKRIVRENIKIGDFVKVVFPVPEEAKQKGLTGERMWVKITRIEEGKIHGRVANTPVLCNFAFDQEVAISINDVIDHLSS